MASGRHGGADRLRGEAGADRKAAAKSLGRRHDVRGDARPFMREQAPGAAHAALHLVEQEQDAVLVAQGPQVPQERPGDLAHAALAHDRLDHDTGGLLPDDGIHGADISGSDLVEALDRGPKPSRCLADRRRRWWRESARERRLRR